MTNIITDTVNDNIIGDGDQIITELPPQPPQQVVDEGQVDTTLGDGSSVLPDPGFEVPTTEQLVDSIQSPSVQPPELQTDPITTPDLTTLPELSNFVPQQLYDGTSLNQLRRARRHIMPEPQLNTVEQTLTPFQDGERQQITGERETGFARFRSILGNVFGFSEVDESAPVRGIFGNNFGDFNFELPGIGARTGPSRLLYMLGLLPNVGQGIGADLGRRAASNFERSGFSSLLNGIRNFDVGEINEANRQFRNELITNIPGSRFFAQNLHEERERQVEEFYNLTEDGNHMPYIIRALSGQDLAFTNFSNDVDGSFNPFGVLGNYESFGDNGRLAELPRVLLGMTLDVALDPFTGIFNDNIDDITRAVRRQQVDRVDVAAPLATTNRRLLNSAGVPTQQFNPIQLRNNIPTVQAEIVDDIPVYIPQQLQPVAGEIIDAEIVRTVRPSLQPTDLVRRLPASSEDLSIVVRNSEQLTDVGNLFNNVFPRGISVNNIDRIIRSLPSNALQDYISLSTRRLGNIPAQLPPSSITNISPSQLVRQLDRPVGDFTRDQARNLRRQLAGEVIDVPVTRIDPLSTNEGRVQALQDRAAELGTTIDVDSDSSLQRILRGEGETFSDEIEIERLQDPAAREELINRFEQDTEIQRTVRNILEPSVIETPEALTEVVSTLPSDIQPVNADIVQTRLQGIRNVDNSEVAVSIPDTELRVATAIDNYNIDFRTVEDNFDAVRTLESQYDELNHTSFDDYDELYSFINLQSEVVERLEDVGDVDVDAIISTYNDLVDNPSTRNAARYIEQIKYAIGNQLEDAYNAAVDSFVRLEDSRQALRNLTTDNNRQAINNAIEDLELRVQQLSQELGQGNRQSCF